jgi:hypothetical protein
MPRSAGPERASYFRPWAIRWFGWLTAAIAAASCGWTAAPVFAAQSAIAATAPAVLGGITTPLARETPASGSSAVAASEAFELRLVPEPLPAPLAGDAEYSTATPAPALGLREVWAISSRQADCAPRGSWGLQYWKHWHAASADEFLASDVPGMPTCFFVHGNRISHAESFYVGWQAYSGLDRQTPPDRSFRFVIWSWPATQIQGQLRDVRAKAYASDWPARWIAARWPLGDATASRCTKRTACW